MTPTISSANAYPPKAIEVSSSPNAKEPVKKSWAAIVKGFWRYTAATGDSDTKSYEGLL